MNIYFRDYQAPPHRVSLSWIWQLHSSHCSSTRSAHHGWKKSHWGGKFHPTWQLPQSVFSICRCQRQIFQKIHLLLTCAKLPLRAIAKKLGISKSSVHRQKKAITKRNNIPLSNIWETNEGYNWLSKLVIAAIYLFGIKKGLVHLYWVISLTF